MGNYMNRPFRRDAADAVENEFRAHRMILREHERQLEAVRAAAAREEQVRLEAAPREGVRDEPARRENAGEEENLEEMVREAIGIRQRARRGEAVRGEDDRFVVPPAHRVRAASARREAARREAARQEEANDAPAARGNNFDDLHGILRDAFGWGRGRNRGGEAVREEAARGDAARGEEGRGENGRRGGARANRDRAGDAPGDDDFLRDIIEGARRGGAARGEAARGEAARGEAGRPRGHRVNHAEVDRRNARRAAAAAMAARELGRPESDDEDAHPDRLEVVRERPPPVPRLNRRQRQRNRQRFRLPEGVRHAQLNIPDEEFEEQQRELFEFLMWQENHEDQDAQAHPNFLRANRVRNRQERAPRVIRDNQYYLAAAREINYNTTCPFCKEAFQNKVYLAHLDACPRAMDDYRDKLAEVHLFSSGVHIFHRDLFKLRETCELSFFETILDHTKIGNMLCVLCKTHTEHLSGRCIRNKMRAVFKKKATIIGARILAHYEQNLELIKQKAVDELLVKHGNYFESVEAFLTDEPADLDTEHQRQAAWFDFKQRSASQTVERTRLIDKEAEKSQALYSTKKAEVLRTIDSFCNSMSTYINDNVYNERLPHIVATRRANPLFQDLEQNVQAPQGEQAPNAELAAPNVAGELNNFLADFRRQREELGDPAVARRRLVNAE